MDVHHHPHVEKKGFLAYFLEFLMIFLAVTLGFIAENIREHFTEKTNAKKYLETYRDELLQQRELIDTYKKIYQNKIIVCDTIKNIFYEGRENKEIQVLERLLIPGITLQEVPFNTSAYDQMVNAGALRYINNIGLRDSMAAYRGQLQAIRDYNTRILQSMVNNTFEISKLEDFHDLVSADTSLSYDLMKHIPSMRLFEALTTEQRSLLVFFYESYIVQSQSDLRRLRRMYASNQVLVQMVNKQLDK